LYLQGRHTPSFHRHAADPFFKPLHYACSQNFDHSPVDNLRSSYSLYNSNPRYFDIDNTLLPIFTSSSASAHSRSILPWASTHVDRHPSWFSVTRYHAIVNPGIISNKCWIKRPACDETVQFIRNYKHCCAASYVVVDLSRVFHAIDSATLQAARRCTHAPYGILAELAVLPTQAALHQALGLVPPLAYIPPPLRQQQQAIRQQTLAQRVFNKRLTQQKRSHWCIWNFRSGRNSGLQQALLDLKALHIGFAILASTRFTRKKGNPYSECVIHSCHFEGYDVYGTEANSSNQGGIAITIYNPRDASKKPPFHLENVQRHGRNCISCLHCTGTCKIPIIRACLLPECTTLKATGLLSCL